MLGTSLFNQSWNRNGVQNSSKFGHDQPTTQFRRETTGPRSKATADLNPRSWTKNVPSDVLHWKQGQKGGFVKGWFWRTCPRSGFRSGGTCKRTLVPAFVPGEHLNVPLFWSSFQGNTGTMEYAKQTCENYCLISEIDYHKCAIIIISQISHPPPKKKSTWMLIHLLSQVSTLWQRLSLYLD